METADDLHDDTGGEMKDLNDYFDPGFTVDDILGDSKTSTYINDAYYALLRDDMAEWARIGTPLSADESKTFEALVLHENWLLDRRHFEMWYQLYTRECSYWIPAVHDLPGNPEFDPQSHVTIAFDDRRRMGDRIVWLRTGVAYSQLPPSYTMHMSTGFVRVPSDRPGEVKIRSQFLLQEMRSSNPVQTLSGWMGHVFKEEDGRWKIDRKIVSLLDGQRTHHNLTYLI